MPLTYPLTVTLLENEFAYLQSNLQLIQEDGSTRYDAEEHTMVATILSKIREGVVNKSNMSTFNELEGDFIQEFLESLRQQRRWDSLREREVLSTLEAKFRGEPIPPEQQAYYWNS